MAVYICSWLHRSADLVWEACLSRASFHLCWYELQISDGFLRLGKTVRVSPVSRVTRHTWHAGLCLCQEGVMLQCCYIQLIMSPWPGHTAHIEPISPSSFTHSQDQDLTFDISFSVTLPLNIYYSNKNLVRPWNWVFDSDLWRVFWVSFFRLSLSPHQNE